VCVLTLDLKQEAEGHEVFPTLMLDYWQKEYCSSVCSTLQYNRSHQIKRTGLDDETVVSEETW